MRFITFGGCVGWMHPGKTDRGIVICNPYGHESGWCQRGVRRLAEQLCASGFHVLRFDYRDTGDSAQANGECNPLETAPLDICAAVAQLRAWSGVQHVTLLGLRLGATFATLAAREASADELILLAPVTSGRIYLRELKALRLGWLENLSVPVRAAQLDSPFNVIGYLYDDTFCEQFSRLDLAREISATPPNALRRVLVCETRIGANQTLVDQFAELGIRVERTPFDGYKDFVQEAALSLIPKTTFAHINQWMRTGTFRECDARENATRTEESSLDMGDIVERPAFFGESPIFGILTQPREIPQGTLALLITNTAANPHHGDGRLSVRLAREMARQGIPALRIDARGFGESARLPHEAADHAVTVHAPSVTEDVVTAARWLRNQGFTTVVTFGICSGGYSSIRAALVEPTISAALSVNMQRFYMPDGISMRELAVQAGYSMAGYASSAFEWAKWKTFLTGKRHPILIARSVGIHIAKNVFLGLNDLLRKVLPAESDLAPDTSTPRGVVQALERKGVRALLIYGEFDNGVNELNLHFGRHGKKIPRSSSVKTLVRSDLDHALFNPLAAAAIISICRSFVEELRTGEEAVGRTPRPVVAQAVRAERSAR
jgi:pimeloyl-ACP methyl ester carboxylesterase